MSVNVDTLFHNVCEQVRKTTLLASTAALLEWDERTKIPRAGGPYRVDQLTSLAGLIHARRTDPKLGGDLAELASGPLAADATSDAGATIFWLKRDFDRRARLPQDLVEEIARATSAGQQQWERAREQSDFAAFAPTLKAIVELKRQEAEALGYDACLYDALLDDYEPMASTDEVRRVLAGLRDALVPILQNIRDSGVEPDTSVLRRHYPADAQHRFGSAIAAQIGFDFDRGRLDTTTHPFCTSLGPNDCRITTRFDEGFFSAGFYGILHEAGHGLYDQGLRDDMYGLPLGDSVSLGIHESQSRLWENMIGRSRAFWEYCLPQARGAFPGAFDEVGVDALYSAVNKVEPSAIRVEADEVTYNLHILIRFELELELLERRLEVSDLSDAWNTKYEQYLGFRPRSDAEGVLQDVHWSAGLFGYFPTYALGNLYAAQFFRQARRDLPDLDATVRKGQFAPLLGWLRDRVHREGRRYSASVLIERVTGQPLSHAAFVEYLLNKMAPIYGFDAESSGRG